jgi:hypothetical protein
MVFGKVVFLINHDDTKKKPSIVVGHSLIMPDNSLECQATKRPGQTRLDGKYGNAANDEVT